MASEIRVNQIQNRSGLSTVTFSDTGVVISGITTITDLRASGNTIVAAGSTSAPSLSPTGDSNTGIFFPSADTIAFAEGGAEALRITSSGNIGIGTDNPADGSKLHVDGGGGLLVRRSSGTSVARFGNTGSVTPNLTIFGSTTVNEPYFGCDGDHLILGTGNQERLRITSGGNVQIANGNLVFSTSGTGIDFSAATGSAAGSTSALLDDYEEGTWDSRPTTSTSSIVLPSGITNVSYNGTYVKIGSMVYLTGYFESTQTSADTSVLYLRLPFAVNGTSNMWSATGTETNLWSFGSGNTYVTVRPESGTSYATFKGCGSGVPRLDLRASNAFASANNYWLGMMMYRTS